METQGRMRNLRVSEIDYKNFLNLCTEIRMSEIKVEKSDNSWTSPPPTNYQPKPSDRRVRKKKLEKFQNFIKNNFEKFYFFQTLPGRMEYNKCACSQNAYNYNLQEQPPIFQQESVLPIQD